jgi:hypothetical protein
VHLLGECADRDPAVLQEPAQDLPVDVVERDGSELSSDTLSSQTLVIGSSSPVRPSY